MDSAAHAYGERKHETCRFGVLNQAWRVACASGASSPALMPICMWKPPEPHPPAITRVWGGAVEYERDCAVCMAHRPV